jgi:predicted transcriptional regulator
MSKKRTKLEGFQIVPLRVPEDVRRRVRDVAEKSRLSDADIMRLAIDRGIAVVEKMFERPTKQAA